MSVSSHLRIAIGEYDRRIRTFIPDYEAMIDAAADALAVLQPRARVIVDLGIGTGALASRCLRRLPRARVVGIDADAGMAAAARRRLGDRVTVLTTDFATGRLPRADAVVASLALHHLRSDDAARRLYRRVRRALHPRGVVVIADRYLAGDAGLARADRGRWLAHLERAYSPARARAFFRAWAGEDRYRPLATELRLIGSAGFVPDVCWCRAGFAVIAARARA